MVSINGQIDGERLRRLHPDWVITFHVGDLKEKE